MAELVLDWLGQAFNNNQMRESFHAMEAAFSCCGTTGPDSYTTGVLPSLPATCCPDDIKTFAIVPTRSMAAIG
ncbi:unnamed protein product [Colias eurytheme]|nr:unnamed protein product [Colias eurytheme]